MNGWFSKKSKLEKLKLKYASLMKKSFETARSDIKKSKNIHHQADMLFEEIRYLSLHPGDK